MVFCAGCIQPVVSVFSLHRETAQTGQQADSGSQHSVARTEHQQSTYGSAVLLTSCFAYELNIALQNSEWWSKILITVAQCTLIATQNSSSLLHMKQIKTKCTLHKLTCRVRVNASVRVS